MLSCPPAKTNYNNSKMETEECKENMKKLWLIQNASYSTLKLRNIFLKEDENVFNNIDLTMVRVLLSLLSWEILSVHWNCSSPLLLLGFRMKKFRIVK